MKIKSLLLDNGKELKLWMPCPECKGESAYKAMNCDRCGNTGEVPRYWTPERAAKEFDFTDDYFPCWYRFISWKGPFWETTTMGRAIREKYGDRAPAVMLIPGQPCPPDDWSEEEQQIYLEEIGED